MSCLTSNNTNYVFFTNKTNLLKTIKIVFREFILKCIASGALTCAYDMICQVPLISKSRFINKICSFSIWNVNVDFQWATKFDNCNMCNMYRSYDIICYLLNIWCVHIKNKIYVILKCVNIFQHLDNFCIN